MLKGQCLNIKAVLSIIPMMARRIFILLVSLYAFSMSYSQYFGSYFNDTGISFCHSNSSFYLTGTTRSFGAGSEDIWIIKVNDELKNEFHTEWGGPHYDIAAEIIATSDNNYILTGHSWDAPGSGTTIILAKYDSTGNNLWVSYFGGKDNDYAFSVIETADYGYLITGTNREAGKEGAAFLIKTDINGVLEWEK